MTLAWLAAACTAGVALGAWWPIWGWPAAFCALLLAAASWVLKNTRLSFPLLLFAAASLGLWRAPHRSPITAHDLAYFNGASVQAQGVVSQEPDVRDRDIQYVVSVSSIQRGTRVHVVSGMVLVRTARSQQLDYGDQVVLTGRLLAPRNSAAVPYASILANRGIGSEMRYPRLLNQGPVQTGWLGWIVTLRQDLEAGINMWLPEPEAALLIAITLGAHSASLGNMAPILAATGLIHIIAISGIKVALVAGTLYSLARRIPGQLTALVIGLVALLGYVLLTGATASGERSALMWALVFLGAYLGRRTVSVVSLSAAGAAMVLIDPGLLGDIGFQMSMVGTLAIVALADPLMERIRFVPSPFREAVSVTVAAQLGTVPIVIFGFHLISFSGWLANALVLPLLPTLILLGFLLGALSVCTPLAEPLAACAYSLTHAVILIARWLASLPGAVPTTTLSPSVTVIYYALFAGTVWAIFRRTGWMSSSRWTDRLSELSLGLGVTAALLTVSAVGADARASSEIVWLGTGNSLLLRSGASTALIDGSSQPFALLEQLGANLPYGAQTIDLVIVTDPRPSSITGLREVLRHYRVETVLDVGAEYPSVAYAQWRADLRRRHVAVFSLRTTAAVDIGRVHITSFGPDAVRPNPQDSIGVLQVRIGRKTLILAGTADVKEQHEAVFRGIELRANILMSAGRAGVDAAFLHAVDPSLLLSTKPVLSPSKSLVLPSGQSRALQL